jgi:hypothetical protein
MEAWGFKEGNYGKLKRKVETWNSLQENTFIEFIGYGKF